MSEDVEQAAALLGSTRLFATVPAEDVRRLAEHAVERSYRRGETIFHEGDAGDTLCVVVRGLVKVFVTSRQGEEMLLVTLGPSETFGELALVDGGERSASARAAEPTTLLTLRRSALLEVLAAQPRLTEALLRSLGDLVRRVTDQAADLVFLDLQGRVAKLLLALDEEHGADADGGRVLDLQLTQGDLASMVGGSRQSVNQILHSFESLGYLEVRGRRLVLLQADMLRRQAGLRRLSAD